MVTTTRRGSAVLAATAMIVAACTGQGPMTAVPPPRAFSPAPTAVSGVALYRVPRIVVRACERAQSLTHRTVLCPTVLPRPAVSSSSEPGVPPQPIGVVATDDQSLLSVGTAPGSVLLNFMYNAPYENDPSKNRPDRFLHFEIYVHGSCCARPPGGERAVLGGKTGVLVRAGAPGPYFSNHVRFFWKQDGANYVATLHEFGAGTTALLGALVAGLKPVRQVAEAAAARTRASDVSVPTPSMTGPVEVTVTGRFLWVASIGDVAAAFQTAAWPARQTGPGLQRFDLRTGHPVGEPIDLGASDLKRLGLIPRVDWRPAGLAAAFGRVWTVVELSSGPAILFGLDGTTGRIVARYREEIPPSKEGDVTSIAAAAGGLWVALYGPARVAHSGEFGGIFHPGSVWRIEPSTGAVTARIEVGAGVVAVAASPGAVWATNYRDDTVSRIDPSTNQVVATIPVGGGPAAIAATSRGVWVTNSLDGTVTRIDARTNQVVARDWVGGDPMGVTATADTIWVTSYSSDTVSAIDADSNRVIARLAAGHGPIGVAEARRRLWVANDLDATITRTPVVASLDRRARGRASAWEAIHGLTSDWSLVGGPASQEPPIVGMLMSSAFGHRKSANMDLFQPSR